MIKKLKCNFDLRKFLIYVLLATVCDVMPLRKLNRLIALKALKEFDINENFAFKKIYNLADKRNKVCIDDLGYLIGPILNSGGRIGKSNYATELLSTNNAEIIEQRSQDLFNLNIKRKIIETRILESINFDNLIKDQNEVIIYYDPNINEGLIGIIASRIKDYCNKPCIVITKSNNLLKGSARSVVDYNIGGVIRNLLDKKIILNGGGHNMAAGFTLYENQLLNLNKFILQDFVKKNIRINKSLNYDSEVSSHILNKDFYDDIKQMEPFGTGNTAPIFLFKDLKVIKSSVLKKKHISCVLKSRTGSSLNTICFNSINTQIGHYFLNYKKYFNVIGQINESFWKNKKTLQLIIKDLIL